MKPLVILPALALACEPLPIPPAPVADTDGAISCPGTQCPCPCAPPLTCGPHRACTKPCESPADCGGVRGETCLGGLCGVACTPGGPDDCAAIGMVDGVCLTIQGAHVCGYAPPVTVSPGEAADDTGL